MSGMLASLSPLKSHIVTGATGSTGIILLMQYIPPLLGGIATAVGIVASIIIAIRAKQQTLIDYEKHEVCKDEKEIYLKIKSLEAEKLEKEINN